MFKIVLSLILLSSFLFSFDSSYEKDCKHIKVSNENAKIIMYDSKFNEYKFDKIQCAILFTEIRKDFFNPSFVAKNTLTGEWINGRKASWDMRIEENNVIFEAYLSEDFTKIKNWSLNEIISVSFQDFNSQVKYVKEKN